MGEQAAQAHDGEIDWHGAAHLAAVDERVELRRKHGLHEGLPVRDDQAVARLLAEFWPAPGPCDR